GSHACTQGPLPSPRCNSDHRHAAFRIARCARRGRCEQSALRLPRRGLAMPTHNPFFEGLPDNGGWIALRGAAAILFGILAFAWPGATLLTLALFWGAYALVDGVCSIAAGIRIRDSGKPMWTLILTGAIGVLAGIAAFVWPGLTAYVILMFIAFWAIFV